MSVHYDASRRRYIVRWREDGRQRARRFNEEAEALEFEERVNVAGRLARSGPTSPPAVAGRVDRLNAERREKDGRDGVYAYATREGVRWRFVYRQSNGTMSSRRGFSSRTAAVTARRALLASIERGEVKVTRESFASFWQRYVDDKRAYMTAGSHEDLVAHGRLRLLPFFGAELLSRIDEDRVREWLAEMLEQIATGDIAPKTVNNARTWLSCALGEAARRGLIARNACDGVPALPIEQTEIEYLRVAEIEQYLAACADHYRELAAFLIGTGVRVSEAVATRWTDLDLSDGLVRIHRQRERTSRDTRGTKGKRFRTVQIGPRLCQTLQELQLLRQQRGILDAGWVFLCPLPLRGRYAGRVEPVPPHRKTVHDWHEAALVDAGIRDMPLHSLRHTAAASWLAAGLPLIYVQRQLGHRSITTTERHYGHLERAFVRDAAASAEALITAAAGSQTQPPAT